MTAGLPVGAPVRVRDLHPLGHCRTPFYARGKRGVVVGVADHEPNPEERAYGRSGLPPVAVYRVRFTARELFSEEGGERDFVVIDLFEPWLEREGETG